MIIKSFVPITKVCNICGNNFIDNSNQFYNPFLYVNGLCSNCMSEILQELLKKGHNILKYGCSK